MSLATESYYNAYERVRNLAQKQAVAESRAECRRTLAWPFDYGRVQSRTRELIRQLAPSMMTPAQLRELAAFDARETMIATPPDQHRLALALGWFAPLAADELEAMDLASLAGPCGDAVPSFGNLGIGETPAAVLPRIAAFDRRYPHGSEALRQKRCGEVAERADAAVLTLSASSANHPRESGV